MPADSDQSRDAPDLVVLPPVIPLVALLVALALEWLLPLGFLPRPLSTAGTIFGACLFLAGICIAVTGALEFRRARTSIDPRQPALVLVETGPYRVTRNPMYVGFLLVFLGVGAIASLDWTPLLWPFLWLALDRMVVVREEAYLSAKFGATYENFRARTRRWL